MDNNYFNDEDKFIENKNASVLAFDEVIGKNSDFEGNNFENSVIETLSIIKYLVKYNCFTENVSKRELDMLIDIIQNTRINLSEPIPIQIQYEYYYILAGWKKHAIFIFHEKNSDNTYTFGFINAGQGADLQGISGEQTNGIVILNNVSIETLSKFYNEYTIFFENEFINTSSNTDGYTINNNSYYGFYKIICDVFDIHKQPSYEINLFSGNLPISFIPIDLQIIGSCCFTNHINYLSYILYKTHPENYLIYFSEWYSMAKIIMREKIYNEIFVSNNKKLYVNEINYINNMKNISIDEDKKLILNNIFLDNQNSEIIPPITEINNDDNNIEYISFSKNIVKEQLKKYSNKENEIEEILNFLISTKLSFSLFNLFGLNLIEIIFDYHLNNNSFYINTLINLYSIKKFINSDSETLFDEKLLSQLSNRNDVYTSYKNLMIILTYNLFFKKKEYYRLNDNTERTQNNIKLYHSILMNLPIMNNEYLKIISLIINDILNNINYYPDISESKEITMEFSATYETDLFRFVLKKTGNYIFKYDDSKKDNFLSKNNLSILSHFIVYEDIFNNYGYTSEEYGNIIETIDTPENNIKIYLEDYKSSNIDNHGLFLSYESKIALLKDQINTKLNNNELNVSYYIVYFYICELLDLNIESDVIDKYKGVIVNSFNNLYHFNTFMTNLIQLYCLKYDISVSLSKCVISIKNENYIFANTEKKLFNEKKYEVSKFINNDLNISYNIGIIGFYVINYKLNILEYTPPSFSQPLRYKKYDKCLLLYRDNDKNTDFSFYIIKNILNQYNILYIALNFTFEKKKKIIIGVDKNNKSNKINIDYSNNNINLDNLIYISSNNTKYLITKSDDLTNSYYKNFYNIMCHNDPNLLLLKLINENIYILKSNLYDVEFEFSDNTIFCLINSIKYSNI